ncbi:hypothetical protein FRB94_000447 [Tulasnella sp. JGI-2019a]|nr:hypothetical protein FRB94_000447 [Tulasnella sp. JGI-2019a]KAG9010342.1 hypothetical protein FRB93_004181 [Tulasnella sp. JGI-2019a]KAG9038632.1 hypothetical protein FRB95_000221 [Tulasnella sp. JGI-2019a]
MASFFQSIFGCCLGRPSGSKDETRPILGDDEIDTERPPLSNHDPLRIIYNDEETLADLIRETESKMVSVQDPHPFMLRPPPPRAGGSQSHSISRSRSPSLDGSHSLTPDGHHSHRSPSSFHQNNAPQDPILQVRIVKTCKGKKSKLHGKGRGRNRTNVRDGSPVLEAHPEAQGEEDLTVSPLTSLYDDLLTSLSEEVQEALDEGFQLVDSGPVVRSWGS